jgi:glycosyltransferase involved in cell wall biosynthesis
MMKRPLRLAVVFEQSVQSGGGHQQELNAAQLAKDLPRDLVEPIFFTTAVNNLSALAAHGFSARELRLPFWKRVFLGWRVGTRSRKLLRVFQRIAPYNSLEAALLAQNVDLVYFLSPNGLTSALERLNYIITVWDLCHRDHPEFPEVRWSREFEIREAEYQEMLPRAVAVMVDSPIGRDNVARRYGVDPERIHVLPFSPSRATQQSKAEMVAGSGDVLARYAVSQPYVFYPAQFWAHKNHVYILEGLKILDEEHGVRLAAVFAGSDRGNLGFVKERAAAMGMSEWVHFLGFVAEHEMPDLYRQAVALVMPTYFGPTNLPPLEAFALGVPVLYPDRPDLKLQVGDAALLVDLNRPASMAAQLALLCSEPDTRQRLIDKGRAQLAALSSVDRKAVLTAVLTEFQTRRATWP